MGMLYEINTLALTMKANINKHISDLLCEHNCVVIPQFGGFVANYQSARIDPKTHYMYAPKKSIVFNKSLQNNDGLLVNEIALSEGLSFKQAQKELDIYVQDLNESLNLYKKVFIDGIGTLLLSAENNILFVQSNTRNHLLDSFGFSTIQYQAIHRNSVQERLEEKIKYIDQNHLTSTKKPWLRVAAIAIPLLLLSTFGLFKKDQIQASYASLFPLKNTAAENIIKTKKIDVTFKVESPTNNIEQAIITFYDSKSKLTLPVETNFEPKHFIIAGAFSSEKNAQKMIRKLKKAHFNNSRIVNQSQTGLYRVCYDGFIASSEARIALKRLKKTNPSAWLLSLN